MVLLPSPRRPRYNTDHLAPAVVDLLPLGDKLDLTHGLRGDGERWVMASSMKARASPSPASRGTGSAAMPRRQLASCRRGSSAGSRCRVGP